MPFLLPTAEFSASRNLRRIYSMKKFMTIMLGLSLVIGSAVVTFAADDTSKSDTSKKKKGKKKKDTSKTDTSKAK
jgi:hypothetical protein